MLNKIKQLSAVAQCFVRHSEIHFQSFQTLPRLGSDRLSGHICPPASPTSHKPAPTEQGEAPGPTPGDQVKSGEGSVSRAAACPPACPCIPRHPQHGGVSPTHPTTPRKATAERLRRITAPRTYRTLAGGAASAPDAGHALPFHPGGCGRSLPPGPPPPPPSLPKRPARGTDEDTVTVAALRLTSQRLGEGRSHLPCGEGGKPFIHARQPGRRRTSKEPQGTLLGYGAGLFSVPQVLNPKTVGHTAKYRTAAVDSHADWTLPGVQLSVPGWSPWPGLAVPPFCQRRWETQRPRRKRKGPGPLGRPFTRDGLFSVTLQPPRTQRRPQHSSAGGGAASRQHPLPASWGCQGARPRLACGAELNR